MNTSVLYLYPVFEQTTEEIKAMGLTDSDRDINRVASLDRDTGRTDIYPTLLELWLLETAVSRGFGLIGWRLNDHTLPALRRVFAYPTKELRTFDLHQALQEETGVSWELDEILVPTLELMFTTPDDDFTRRYRGETFDRLIEAANFLLLQQLNYVWMLHAFGTKKRYVLACPRGTNDIVQLPVNW